MYEIGPGKGILTEQLARRYRRVVAVEVDACLANELRCSFANRRNVTIHEGDFLRYPLPHQRYEVVANIPFNMTAALVAKLTMGAYPPEQAHLVVQRAAAETLAGQPHELLRTVLLKPWFDVEIVHHFRRTDFIPVPRVDVVMLRLRKRGPPLVRHADRQCFRNFAVHVFTAWHPTVAQTLQRLCGRRHLDTLRRELDFSLDVPPTSMTVAQWIGLYASFHSLRDARALALIHGSEARLTRQQNVLQKIHRTRVR